MVMIRVGFGYDVHQLVEDRPLILGGVTIEHHKGLLGHSDADVLTHAIMDAMLGALALGSIGDHFPDTDSAYKGADSIQLLKHVHQLITNEQYQLVNIDSVIVAQQPKLKPHIQAIQEHLETTLTLPAKRVSVKATTSERLGFEGRLEGISAHATVLLTDISNE